MQLKDGREVPDYFGPNIHRALFIEPDENESSHPASHYKIEKVLHEFKHGALHSGSKHGPKVKSRAQAIAIAMSEQRKYNHK